VGGSGAPAGIRTRVFGSLPLPNGERPKYMVHGVFNLAILGRKGVVYFLLLPEPQTGAFKQIVHPPVLSFLYQ
jgi:hypothetical protein